MQVFGISFTFHVDVVPSNFKGLNMQRLAKIADKLDPTKRAVRMRYPSILLYLRGLEMSCISN